MGCDTAVTTGHCNQIAEHIGAYCIFGKLRETVVTQLYSPGPKVAPFVGCMDEIEGLLDEVIPNIPDECRGDVLTQVGGCTASQRPRTGGCSRYDAVPPLMAVWRLPRRSDWQVLACCVESLESKFRGWDSRYRKGDGGVISLEEIDVVDTDLAELKDFFTGCLLSDDTEEAQEAAAGQVRRRLPATALGRSFRSSRWWVRVPPDQHLPPAPPCPPARLCRRRPRLPSWRASGTG